MDPQTNKSKPRVRRAQAHTVPREPAAPLAQASVLCQQNARFWRDHAFCEYRMLTLESHGLTGRGQADSEEATPEDTGVEVG